MKSRDFNFLKNLFNGFFSKKPIQDALIDFYSEEISDFEPWVQVELARHMSTLPNPHEWKREEFLPLDGRKAKNIKQNGMYIDFLIRPYNHKKDWYILLELKQKMSIKSCITAMNKDISKVSMSKSSSMNSRSIWVAGIHSREKKAIIREMVLKKAEKLKIPIDSDFIFTKVIPNTNCCFTLYSSIIES